ncbi:MAG TPA: sulfite exporter TauE/SafE family protein [Jatrophihabitantaceae bacterium]
MHWTLALGSLVVGVVVGLTGMGGGALMTPMLVLFFNVSPLAAVSSDLVASAIMKPVGSYVHLRKGTVRLDLVGWLCVGSVPAAFCGVLITRALGHGSNVENLVQRALGVALVVAAAGLFLRAHLRLAERARTRDGSRAADPVGPPSLRIRPVPTVLVGIVGGVVVGMTSVGSGSLIIIALMFLYPTLRASELVGTDLVQAVPLVASAALGHILFGDFKLGLTASLLAGAIPGAYVGAQLSTRLPSALIRRALAFVLLASALKMFNISSVTTGIVLVAVVAAAPLVWMWLRRAHGFSALPWREPVEQRAMADT